MYIDIYENIRKVLVEIIRDILLGQCLLGKFTTPVAPLGGKKKKIGFTRPLCLGNHVVAVFLEVDQRRVVFIGQAHRNQPC